MSNLDSVHGDSCPHSFCPHHQKRQLGGEEWAEAKEPSSFSTKATHHALTASLLLSLPFSSYFFNIHLMPGTEGTEMTNCRACPLEAHGLEGEEGIGITSKSTITWQGDECCVVEGSSGHCRGLKRSGDL